MAGPAVSGGPPVGIQHSSRSRSRGATVTTIARVRNTLARHWAATGGPLAHFRWLLLLLSLANAILFVPVVAGAGGSLVLPALVSLVGLCAWWVWGFRRRDFPVVGLLVETPALLLVVLGAGHPGDALRVLFTAFYFRTLHGTVRDAALTGAAYLGAFYGAVMLTPQGGGFGGELAADQILANVAGFALGCVVTRMLVGSLAAHDRLRAALQASEATARADEARFRALIEGSAEGIAVVSEDGVLRYVSGASAGVLGVTPDGLVGRALFACVHPDDLPAMQQDFGSLGGQPGACHTSSFRARHADGTWRWLEGTATNRIDDPAVGGVIINFRDVTARHDAAAAITRLQRRTHAILAAAGEGIYGLDREGFIVFSNPAATHLLGYSQAELLGKSAHRLLHHSLPDGMPYPATSCPIYAALHDGAVHRIADEVFWRKDGTALPVEYVSAPLRERDDAASAVPWLGTDDRTAETDGRPEDGAITGAVVAFRDLTAHLRTAAALEEARDAALAASETKSAFLANMSHEIRTPMNAILGMADLLAETPLTPEQQEYVTIFRRAGDALLTLIDDILDLSKVESGQLELEATAFDPAVLLEEVAELVAPRAHAKGLELTCEVATDVPAGVVGDPQRLRQVLLNLAGNAVKFTTGGAVALRVGIARPPATDALDGDEPVAPAGPRHPADAGDPVVVGPESADTATPQVVLEFTVRDTGMGIAAEKLAAVFEAFTQEDASTTRRFGGTGLGLAIVKRLTALMGGIVRVESKRGYGSLFAVTLPLERAMAVRDRAGGAAGPAGPVGPAGAMAAAGAPGGTPRAGDGVAQPLRLRLLLVDDSADNRRLVQLYLSRLPYVLETATDGQAGVEAFMEGEYDLVLMDMHMPVLDGLAATRAIRAWEVEQGYAPTPIAALTASAMAEDVQGALAAGCDTHVAKPVKKSTLLEVIRQAALRRPPVSGRPPVTRRRPAARANA